MTPESRPWDEVIPSTDLEIFEAAGFGRIAGPGAKAALVIVDVSYAFLGRRPLPIEEAVKSQRTSCGDVGWAAVPHIARLASAARTNEIPVVYTTGQARSGPSLDRQRVTGKVTRAREDPTHRDAALNIVSEIAPTDDDFVIRKPRPSAFFGTALASFLLGRGIDTIVVCGGTTSGCVRATVVDAFSYDLRVLVPHEATFDRGRVSHAVSLFDLHQKYADVVLVTDAAEYLTGGADQSRPELG